MTLVTRRLLFNNFSVYILNRLYNPQSCAQCVRYSQFLRNKFVSVPADRAKIAVSIQNSLNTLQPVDFVPFRYKSNKKQSGRKDDDEDDEEYDDDAVEINDFKEGNSSDRNLAQIKVQTFRLDGVVKAGLGYPKKKIEKLFYESKIRVNGKKITKKSMDIVKDCEIDVIKGPSPENANFLLIGRIEILSVKSDGLYFVITLRRNKNLVIENYEAGARYTDAE